MCAPPRCTRGLPRWASKAAGTATTGSTTSAASATEIVPAWQVIEGEAVPGGPIAFTAAIARPGEAFVLAIQRNLLDFTLAFELRADGGEPASSAGCGHILSGGRVVERFGLGPGDEIMVRKQLLELRNAPLADSPCRYRDRMAKSQKRDIPAGATAVATNMRRDFDILDEIEFGIMLKGSGAIAS